MLVDKKQSSRRIPRSWLMMTGATSNGKRRRDESVGKWSLRAEQGAIKWENLHAQTRLGSPQNFSVSIRVICKRVLWDLYSWRSLLVVFFPLFWRRKLIWLFMTTIVIAGARNDDALIAGWENTSSDMTVLFRFSSLKTFQKIRLSLPIWIPYVRVPCLHPELAIIVHDFLPFSLLHCLDQFYDHENIFL